MGEMANVVELQFELVEGKPIEAGWGCQVQVGCLRVDFAMAEFGISQKLSLRVWLIDYMRLVGFLRNGSEKLISETMAGPRFELRFARRKVEVNVEKGVEGDMPVPVG